MQVKIEGSEVEALPLVGKRVLVTRSKNQAEDLSRKIRALGGETIEYAMIKMVPPHDLEPLDYALNNINAFNWIIFTSVNGVKFFWERFMKLGIDSNRLQGIKIAAVGPVTAQEVEKWGGHVDLMPTEYRNEALLEAIRPRLQQGDKLLLPRSDIGRDILPRELRAWGYEVVDVNVYETVPDETIVPELLSFFRQKKIHIITFTSPSTVKNFLVGLSTEERSQLLADVKVICIGPVTEAAARELGLQVDRVARDYTIDGLIEVMLEL